MSKKDKILKSSMVLVAAKWIQRLLGIVSLLILARILSPSDFGIAALSFVVVSFFEAISVSGGQQYILSRKTVTPNDLNIAFTLSFIMKAAIGFFVFLLAPIMANLFNEPRLEVVLHVVAVIPIINALSNPGVFQKQRNFDYRAIAIVRVLTKLSSFIVVVSLAIFLESYWALIAGNLMTASTRTALSYVIHPHRPRLVFTGISKQWVFSKWMLARSIVGFTRAKVDQFIVGIGFNTEVVGAYNVSKELVLMPFGQIAEPLSPIFLSMYNRSKEDISSLRRSYTIKFIVMFAIMLPITIGVYYFRYEIVTIILGEKWLGVEHLIGALSPLILTYTLSASSSAVLVVLERMRFLFTIEIVTLGIIVLGQLAASSLPIEQFAAVRTILGVFTFIVYFIAVSYTLRIQYIQFFVALIPACLSGMSLILMLVLLNSQLDGLPLLLVSGFSGGVLYIASFVFFMSLFKQHSDVDYSRKLLINYLTRAKERLLKV